MGGGLTLRWRIHQGALPLRRRHFRHLAGLGLPEALLAWAHERLEWAMLNMLDSSSEAVLVIELDPAKQMRLSIEPLRDPPRLTPADLVGERGALSGVSPDGEPLAGLVWLEQDGGLIAATGQVGTAVGTLCWDLAQTLGIAASAAPQPLALARQAAAAGRAFLTSDEFGFVAIGGPPPDGATPAGRIQAAFARLW